MHEIIIYYISVFIFQTDTKNYFSFFSFLKKMVQIKYKIQI